MMKTPVFSIEFEKWTCDGDYYFNPPDSITIEEPGGTRRPITDSDVEECKEIRMIVEHLGKETIAIEYFTDLVIDGPESHLHIACPGCKGEPPSFFYPYKWRDTDVYFEDYPTSDLDKYGPFVAECGRCKARYLVFGFCEGEKEELLLANPVDKEANNDHECEV